MGGQTVAVRLGQVLGDGVSHAGHQDAAGALGLLALRKGILQLRVGETGEVHRVDGLGGEDQEVLIEPIRGQHGEVLLLHRLTSQLLRLGRHAVHGVLKIPDRRDDEESDDVGTGLVLQPQTHDRGRGHLHVDGRTPLGGIALDRDRPGLIALDQHRDSTVATVLGVGVERVRTGLAIGEEAHIHNLQAVGALELLGDRHHGVHSLIERRTTESKALRAHRGTTVIVAVRNGEHHRRTGLELTLGHPAGQNIQQAHMTKTEVVAAILAVVRINRVFLADRAARRPVARIGLALDVDAGAIVAVRIREQIDLVGDVDSLAEHDQVEQLVDRAAKLRSHRTRPVHAEDHAVVLALGNLLDREEDIIRELVIVDAVHVDDTATSRARTARFVGSHLHLKLLHEHLDVVAIVGAELLEQLVAVVRLGLTRRDSGELLGDRLVTDHNRANLHRRHLPTTNRGGGHVDHRLLGALLGAASHRASGLGVAVAERTLLTRSIRLAGTLLTVVILLVTLVTLVATAVRGIVALSLSRGLGAGVAGTVRIAVRRTVRILRLGSLTRTIVLVDFRSEAHDILPGLGSFQAGQERSFVRGHRHGSDTVDTRLEVEVEAVEQRQRRDLLGSRILDAEEVLVEQILASFSVATLEAGEVVLHLAVDANVLHDIEVIVNHADIDADIRIDGSVRLIDNRSISGSVERVADLVSAEHIVQIARHLLPNRQGQHTGLRAERSRVSGRVMHDGQILGRQQARERILGGRVDGERVARGGNGRRRVSHSAPIVPDSIGHCKPLET